LSEAVKEERHIIGFRPGRLKRAFDQRGDNDSLVAKRDLERYYQAVDDEISGLGIILPELEVLWLLLERVSFHVTPDTYRYLAVHLGEIRDWPQARVRKLLLEGSPLQVLALVDYAERTYQFKADPARRKLSDAPYLSLPPVRTGGVPAGGAEGGPDPRRGEVRG
jgi:hypothetical protein